MKSQFTLLHYTGPSYAGGVETAIGDFITGALRDERGVKLITGTATDSADGITALQIELIRADDPTVRLLSEPGAEIENIRPIEDSLFCALRQAIAPGDCVHIHNVACNTFNIPLARALRRLAAAAHVRLVAWCWDPVWIYDLGRNLTREQFQLLCTPWPNTLYLTLSHNRTNAFRKLGGFPDELVVEFKPFIDIARVYSLTRPALEICQRYALLEADLVITYPCRTSRRKNIEFAISILSELRQQGRDPRLLLGGFTSPHRSRESEVYKAELESLATDLHVLDCIIWLDMWRDRDDLSTGLRSQDVLGLHRISDLFFSPSQDEGFGLGVLEGAANGTPILASIESCEVFASHSSILSFDLLGTSARRASELILESTIRRRADRAILARYGGRSYFQELEQITARIAR